MHPNLTTSDRLLRAQVLAQVWCLHARHRLGARLRRDERGDVYSTVIAVAVSVVIAITVGGILFAKFTDKANSIDTDTPVVSVP